MTIQLSALMAQVEQIRSLAPVYAVGGTGARGTCDCVGLLMGAMMRAGHAAYPMHSSNYFARYQTVNLTPHTETGALFLGEVLYKARAPGQSGYDLHERYLQGGRYWTGDTLDYYHIGLVTALQPLTITHCTLDAKAGINGITTDTRLGAWAFGGALKGVNYTQGGISTMAALYDAKVVTTGGALNIRTAAAKGASIAGRAANGALLQVLEETDDTWAHVYWNGVDGYAMRAYLSRISDTTDEAATANGTVALNLTPAEAAALKAIAARL